MLTCLENEPTLTDFALHFYCMRGNLKRALHRYEEERSPLNFDMLLVCTRILMDALKEILKDWNPRDSALKNECNQILKKFNEDSALYRAVCDRVVHGPPRGPYQRDMGYEAWDRYCLMRHRARPEKTDVWLTALLDLISPLEQICIVE